MPGAIASKSYSLHKNTIRWPLFTPHLAGGEGNRHRALWWIWCVNPRWQDLHLRPAAVLPCLCAGLISRNPTLTFRLYCLLFFKQENNIVLGMPILFPITPCNQVSHIFLAVSLLEGYILLESINFSQILAQVLPLLYHIIFFVVSKFIRLNL